MVGLNNVQPKLFQQHLEYLSIQNNSKLTITFDDGFEDVFKFGFPILKNFKFNVVVFQISSFIGEYSDWDVNFTRNRSKHLSKAQLIELSKNGWEIGSHGHLHISSSKMTMSELIRDLQVSKELLEDLLNKEVSSYTPPFGKIHPQLFPALIQTGYKTVYLHNNSRIRMPNNCSTLNIVFRQNVYNIDTVRNLRKKIYHKKIELLKDNLIHFCANATIGAKDFLCN